MESVENQKAIELWRNRIIEIEKTGNCSNGHPHGAEPYFIGYRQKYTKEEMIAFCEKQIGKLRAEKVTA